jgi:hypothetical protein
MFGEKASFLWGIIFLSFALSTQAAPSPKAYRLFMVLDGNALKCEKIFEISSSPRKFERQDPLSNGSSNIEEWILRCYDESDRVLSTTPVHFQPNAASLSRESQYVSDGDRFDAVIPQSDLLSRCRLFHAAKGHAQTDTRAEEIVAECGLAGIPRLRISEIVKTMPPFRNVEKIRDWGPDKNRISIAILSANYSMDQIPAYHERLRDILFRPLTNFVHSSVRETVPGTFFTPGFEQFEKAMNIYVFDIPDFDPAIVFQGFSEEQSKAILDEWTKDYLPIPPSVYEVLHRESGSAGGFWVGHIYSNSEKTMFMHRMSHWVANLGDEFVNNAYCNNPFPTKEPPLPNITISTNRENLKWKQWLDEGTPLPTPSGSAYWNLVGAFPGGYYCPDRYYHPQDWCLMQVSGLLLCKVCLEAFTIDMLTKRINIFDSTGHDWNTLPIYAADSPSLHPSVIFDEALYSCIVNPRIIWYLDDQPMPQWGDQANPALDTTSLPSGQHVIKIGVIGGWRGTDGFIRKNVDTNFYHSFPQVEIAKGKIKKKR